MADLLSDLPPVVNAIFMALLTGGLVGLVTTLLVQQAERGKMRRRILQVAGGGQAARGLALRGQPGGGQRRRMVTAKLKEIEEKAKAQKSSKQTLRDMLLQANLEWTPRKFYTVSSISAVVVTTLYLVNGFSPALSPLVAITAGLGLPRWVVKRMASRRQKAFTFKFADAIDVIVRGIRSGLPVGECLNIIGREMPEPIGLEFRLIVEGQRLGMTLDEVMAKALLRMPIAELKFFSIVLAIQQQTGGNLADTLAKLSDVLRGRKKLRDKIQSLSSEAKASAMIIGSLPVFVSGVLFLVNPDYMRLLFVDPIGHVMLTGGIVWMGIGVFIMARMIAFDY